MTEHKRQLTELSEEQRALAYQRYALLRPHLEEGVSQTTLAQQLHMPLSTLQRWLRRYDMEGICGLVRHPRVDRGQRRDMPTEMIHVIEGLALRTPRRSIATVHRQVCELAGQQGWPLPSYGRVYQIVHALSPAVVTLAHEGAAPYRETFDLIYRREAKVPNELWQADHYRLPFWLLDPQGKPAKAWLTVIEDDYSRAVPSYRLSWSAPSTANTALALRQAIWRKDDPRWPLCGIPAQLYTDHGSDFTSTHLEQVAADLKIQLLFSQPGRPRGRGKIERFFRTVEQLFLQPLPGYAPKQMWHPRSGQELKTEHNASLTLEEFDQAFRTWLLDQYHQRVHSELGCTPLARWEEAGFLPNMPESLEYLDLLLVAVRKSRHVQQEGIAFEGYWYSDSTLASYVGEDVMIRYDPSDMAEIRVFFQDRFLCCAICPELSGQTVSLKEIVTARSAQHRRVLHVLTQRESSVKRVLEGEVRGVQCRGDEPMRVEDVPSVAMNGEKLPLSKSGEMNVASPLLLKSYMNE